MERLYERRGLVLIQSDCNLHCRLFDKKSGKTLLRYTCAEAVTEKTAAGIIDGFLDYVDGTEF